MTRMIRKKESYGKRRPIDVADFVVVSVVAVVSAAFVVVVEGAPSSL